MYDVFAPSATLSTESIVDCVSLNRSYHAFIADVTNAYFLVDEHDECYVDHWLREWSSKLHWGIRPLCFGDCENSCMVGDALERAGQTSWQRLEEQSFDRCDAAPQFFANYELDVFIQVHKDDLHGTGPRLALEQIQANLSQRIPCSIWTVTEVGTRYEHLERERVLDNHRTELVPNEKKQRVLLHNMGAELQTSATAECSWIRQAEARR